MKSDYNLRTIRLNVDEGSKDMGQASSVGARPFSWPEEAPAVGGPSDGRGLWPRLGPMGELYT